MFQLVCVFEGVSVCESVCECMVAHAFVCCQSWLYVRSFCLWLDAKLTKSQLLDMLRRANVSLPVATWLACSHVSAELEFGS